jgi:hypothetical protein
VRGDSTASTSILIAIGENNEIWMDRRLIDPRAVRANIELMHAKDPASLLRLVQTVPICAVFRQAFYFLRREVVR